MTHSIEDNNLKLEYEDDEAFDADILIHIEKMFELLDPKKPIVAEIKGQVPIEVLAYMTEISKYCDLTVVIPDDKMGRTFIEQLKMQNNLNIKVKDMNGE